MCLQGTSGFYACHVDDRGSGRPLLLWAAGDSWRLAARGKSSDRPCARDLASAGKARGGGDARASSATSNAVRRRQTPGALRVAGSADPSALLRFLDDAWASPASPRPVSGPAAPATRPARAGPELRPTTVASVAALTRTGGAEGTVGVILRIRQPQVMARRSSAQKADETGRLGFGRDQVTASHTDLVEVSGRNHVVPVGEAGVEFFRDAATFLDLLLPSRMCFLAFLVPTVSLG